MEPRPTRVREPLASLFKISEGKFFQCRKGVFLVSLRRLRATYPEPQISSSAGPSTSVSTDAARRALDHLTGANSRWSSTQIRY